MLCDKRGASIERMAQVHFDEVARLQREHEEEIKQTQSEHVDQIKRLKAEHEKNTTSRLNNIVIQY
jgi:hypothetical protein